MMNDKMYVFKVNKLIRTCDKILLKNFKVLFKMSFRQSEMSFLRRTKINFLIHVFLNYIVNCLKILTYWFRSFITSCSFQVNTINNLFIVTK